MKRLVWAINALLLGEQENATAIHVLCCLSLYVFRSWVMLRIIKLIFMMADGLHVSRGG